MFTKDDFFLNETYNPPMGEKDVYIFPGLLGANSTRDSDFFYGIKLKANRIRDYSGDVWEITWRNYSETTPGGKNYFHFRCKAPMNIFKVLDVFNKKSQKREEMFRSIVDHVFSNLEF